MQLGRENDHLLAHGTKVYFLKRLPRERMEQFTFEVKGKCKAIALQACHRP
jgi:hypothetical protein